MRRDVTVVLSVFALCFCSTAVQAQDEPKSGVTMGASESSTTDPIIGTTGTSTPTDKGHSHSIGTRSGAGVIFFF